MEIWQKGNSMIWHPLSVSIILLDLVTFAILLISTPALFRFLLLWQSGDPAENNLNLENRFKRAAFQNSLGFRISFFSTFLFFMGVSSIFPSQIPGAMCGTGVMQALGTGGYRILVLRIGVLALFALFSHFRRFSLKTATDPFKKTSARILLLLLPAMFLLLWETIKGLTHMNTVQPVSCCSAMLNHLNSTPVSRSFMWDSWLDWLSRWGALVLCLVLIALQVFQKKRKWIQIPLALLWSLSSYPFLTKHVLPYQYGVPEHHCIWCAFKLQYFCLGYLLLGAVIMVNWLAIRSVIDEFQPVRNRNLSTRDKLVFILTFAIFYAAAFLPFLKRLFS